MSSRTRSFVLAAALGVTAVGFGAQPAMAAPPEHAQSSRVHQTGNGGHSTAEQSQEQHGYRGQQEGNQGLGNGNGSGNGGASDAHAPRQSSSPSPERSAEPQGDGEQTAEFLPDADPANDSAISSDAAEPAAQQAGESHAGADGDQPDGWADAGTDEAPEPGLTCSELGEAADAHDLGLGLAYALARALGIC